MRIKEKITHIFAFTAFAILIGSLSASAQIGFYGTLETPPLFVSTYKEPFEGFSAAIYPQTHLYLSQKLRFKSRATTSQFETRSIRFETDYYQRGREKYSLIPVSVDADNFMAYRFRRLYLKNLSDNFQSSVVDKKDQRGQSGLGVQIALPRRLEKIFGEGSAGLKVSGYKKVSFAGQSRWNDNAVTTSGVSQSKFPTLKMDQIDRFNITGTIGSKITVKVTQDSQTDIPLANRIQIRYKGDDDDILKSIEAGNTTLSLPNTRFVGYSSQIRGLFGLKAEAQIGNLKITGIASQEKGSTEKTSVSANGDESPDFIRDYEYVERRVFDLGLPGEIAPNDTVSTIYFYETAPSYNDDKSLPYANFYVNPNDTMAFTSENIIGNNISQVTQIESSQYTLVNDHAQGKHYVVFNSSRSRSYNLGCYMEIKRADGTLDTLGRLGLGDNKLLNHLKLISPSDDATSPSNQTWQLMWRNCYDVPKGALVKDLKIKVYKGLSGSEGKSTSEDFQIGSNDDRTNYLRILGLDQLSNCQDSKSKPDDMVDDCSIFYRPEWGLLIFPHRTPFDTDTTYVNSIGEMPPLADDARVPNIYNYTSFTEKSENSEFYIQLTTTTRGSIIRLNQANIIENSEVISLNGEVLKRDVDYSIQYDFGQVTLTSDKATDPNASINIEYEYAPFFAVQKKSLLGLRAEYEWSKDLQFGTTFLYKSDKAQERKPKVGQETARTIIFDTDLSLKLYPTFLTKAVDALPLIETETKSNFTLSAEIAQSHPNPNVNDIAYVDDFESALDNLSLGTTRHNWKRGSLPYTLNSNEYIPGKMLWHQTYDVINVEDVYNRDTEVGGGTMRPFRMRFTPKNYRYDIVVDSANNVDTVNVVPSKSYGSIMRYFGSRVDDNRAQLLEVRLKVDTTGAYVAPILHFDFGRINEDLNGNNLSDSEEKPNPPRDNEILSVEDIGLDTLADNDEPGYDPITNPDPNGDNWYSFGETNPDTRGKCPLPPPNYCDGITKDNPIFYDYLNGTEGNYNDVGGNIPDKETYSTNFNTADAYFSFHLDIRNYPDSFKVEGSERNGWVTYRIPIRDSAAVDEYVRSESNLNPEWNVISHVRVWMEADEFDSNPVSVEIADWYFVQMNWQDSVVYSPLSDRRSQFVVASIADDVDSLFSPPAGVEAYEDPQTNVTEVQKGLSLDFTDLNSYDTCLATKELLNVDQYSGYRRMEMFVHGDESTANAADMAKVKFFFRIGRDNRNYYEYHTDIYPGWDERNHVNIDFNEVTALKDSAQKELGVNKAVDISNSTYRVFGNPNINEIRFFAAGVVNKDTADAISGQIWLDELRVTDVRKDVGTAGRISVTGNMADFINYNFTLQSQDPYFRGLSSATRGGSSNNLGSGRQQTTLNTGLTVNLQKMLPRSWEASLPVTFSYAKTVTTPLLRNNSDIVLPEETQKEEQIISESKTVSVSAKFNKKDGNPLFKVILNRFKPRFSYRRNNQKTVTYPYSYGENIDIDADYDLSIKKMPTIPIFFWTKSIPILKKTTESRLSFYPETWTVKGRFNRTITVNDDINFKRTSSLSRDFSGSVNVKYNMFSNLTTSFNYDTYNDLSELDDISLSLRRIRLGTQNRYSQRFSASYDPRLLSFLSSSFSYKSTYSDDYVPSNVSRRSTLTRNMSVSGTFEHQVLFGGSGTGSNERRFAGRRGAGRRSNVKDDEKEDKKKFYAPLLTGIRKLTSWVNPVKYGYSETYNNSLPGMLVRPGFRYRLGIEEDPNVPVASDTRTQTSGKGKSYDFSSGFVLFGGLTTNVKYQTSESYDIVKANTRHRDVTTNWPDLSIRISQFRTFPLVKKYINKFIDIFSPRTGFSRQIKEQYDIDGDFLTNRTETQSFNPLMQVNFKLFRSLSIASSVNKSETKKDNFTATDGAYLSSVLTTKNSLSFTGKYSFSSPHGLTIPLFGKLKFKSTVDLTMTVKYNETQTKNQYPDGQESISADKSDISYSPVIAYTFSQQIKGGLTLVWKDTKDQEKRSYAREVQIWTEIRF